MDIYKLNINSQKKKKLLKKQNRIQTFQLQLGLPFSIGMTECTSVRILKLSAKVQLSRCAPPSPPSGDNRREYT